MLDSIAAPYDVYTHIGAYLFREKTFRPNGLVGSMALELLDTYLDASGNQSNVKDKLVTVNGCLSTPVKWQEFDIEWQTALKDFGFIPNPKIGRCVFHATDFHSDYCKLSPKGLSKANKQSLYRDLIKIVRKHSLLLVGFAVALKDYAKFADDYPSISKFCFGKPGTFISVLGVGKCMEWAGEKGYSKSISLMFDRGDEFWGEMFNGFRAFVKTPVNEHLNIGSLTCGNKVEFSPLQAADIVAWECRKYFNALANIKITVAGITPRYELEMLRRPHSFFTLFEYADLKRRVSEIFPDANGDIIGIEKGLKQAADERDVKLRLKKERRNARKENQNEKGT